jgi:diketogulonate reductase-like aldo/keto reductase
VLQQVADKYGATPRQVALRFLVQQPNLFAIPKAATIPHVEDNAGAFRFALTDEDVRTIDAAFPARPLRELPML